MLVRLHARQRARSAETHEGITSTPWALRVCQRSARCSLATFCNSSAEIFPAQYASVAFFLSTSERVKREGQSRCNLFHVGRRGRGWSNDARVREGMKGTHTSRFAPMRGYPSTAERVMLRGENGRGERDTFGGVLGRGEGCASEGEWMESGWSLCVRV